MTRTYDKDFLVDVYISRYAKSGVVSIERLLKLEEQAKSLYDKVGKIEFRKYASVTPEAIQEYLNS